MAKVDNLLAFFSSEYRGIKFYNPKGIDTRYGTTCRATLRSIENSEDVNCIGVFVEEAQIIGDITAEVAGYLHPLPAGCIYL